jgi:hypothetical protein
VPPADPNKVKAKPATATPGTTPAAAIPPSSGKPPAPSTSLSHGVKSPDINKSGHQLTPPQPHQRMSTPLQPTRPISGGEMTLPQPAQPIQ